MDDPINLLIPFVIISLVAVIMIQALERYFFGEQMHKEQSRLIAAIISKNSHEYTEVVRTEKMPQEPLLKEEPENVEQSQLSDDEFMKMIRR